VIDAASGQQDLVIVGQSYGAFTATLVAARLPVRLLVLLAGMIPGPREKARANGGPTPATGTPSNGRPGSTAARPATTTR
jgi:pimeloyl-ACP methyl ester carboxylesterase